MTVSCAQAACQILFVELLIEVEHAHHSAFTATNGADLDWPIWYADHLTVLFGHRFDMKFYRSQLVYCLMDTNFEHQARSPKSNWSEYCVDEIIERYAPSESPEETSWRSIA